jgi:hypothetical protein
MHSTSPDDQKRQIDVGLMKPATDFESTGAVQPHLFGEKAPVGTVWSYREDPGSKLRNLRPDLLPLFHDEHEPDVSTPFGKDWSFEDPEGKFHDLGFDLSPAPHDDHDHAASDVEGDLSIAGYREFKDAKGQRILVPQLGFGSKPHIDTRQLMCHDVPVIDPGLAKRRGGPKGENVVGSTLLEWLHGGKHFFDTDTEAETVGEGQVMGVRKAPGKPIAWYFSSLPADAEKRDKIDETMKTKADTLIKEKRNHHETLKAYYVARAAFIDKYKGLLK